MRFLKPTTDIAFKKLFGCQKRSALTISFLNSILDKKDGEKITHVIINDGANHPTTIDKKMSFVDVSCTDQKNKHYIVEMQVIDEKNFIERAQYYAAFHLSRQLNAGDGYQKLVPVIFVGIVCFDLFKNNNYISRYFLQEHETGDRSLNLLEFHFVELHKFEKELEDLVTDTDKWSYLMQQADAMITIPPQLKTPHEMVDALQVLEEGTWSSAEYENYMTELDQWRGKESLQTFFEQKGRIEGLAEGEKKGLLKAAQAMLIEGLNAPTIAKITKLSIEEIMALKK
ncbi:Rpn family recombination-promoting nuclease/putative transposase [bacterium]|nr:MAG: Rpn family recombination-promoting nuclease/putative transposase [bacterium]